MMKKSLFTLLGAALLALTSGCFCCEKSAPATQAPDTWADREWLVKSVVKNVPAILATYHPETGEFGEAPWVCLDQNPMFILAVAWGTQSPNNPYYHSDELLKVIAKAGERLVDAQDNRGMWTFRKKDNSTWGQIHMPWTYIRWIRAYSIVKDALPAAARAKWEKGLKLGYSHIVRSCKGKGTHNITALNAAGLYLAGMEFGNEDWKNTVRSFMHRVCAKQAADGFWSEHHGPVVMYNTYYLEALGLYYSYAKDPVVLEALNRGIRFHSALLWQDGSSVSVIDERNPYSANSKQGNVGFSFTPAGRRYLLQHLGKHMQRNLLIDGELAAVMLWNGATGKAAPAPSASSRYDSKDQMFAVVRQAPYQWALSAYHCPACTNRWIMDRQTHVEIAIDDIGVIGSGGNTKMQPYFSTFTFGDPDAFQPDYKNTSPDFINKTKLQYLPDHAKISGNSVLLTYGKNKCAVTVIPGADDLRVEYRLNNAPDAPAMAHFPVKIASSLKNPLTDGKVYTGKMLNNKLAYRNGLEIVLPDNAQVRPSVLGFNPYEKFGRYTESRLVISLPLSADTPVQTLRFIRHENKMLKGAEIFPAMMLEPASNGTAFKMLEDKATSVFLRSTAAGGELYLTLHLPEAAERELFLGMNHYNCYGTVQVLVNGEKVGKPFSTYATSLIFAEPEALGKVKWKKGKNIITLRIVGREKGSANFFTSIREVYLK